MCRSLSVLLIVGLTFLSCNNAQKSHTAVVSTARVDTGNKVPEFNLGLVVSEMAADNVLKGEGLCEGGICPLQRQRFYQLKKYATTEELRALIDHENAVVRCYAFEALLLRRDTSVFSALLKHVGDAAIVEVHSFPMRTKMQVSDYFVNTVKWLHTELDSIKQTGREREMVDSLLHFDSVGRN